MRFALPLARPAFQKMLLECQRVNCIYRSFTTLTSVGYGEITPCNEFEMLYCTGAYSHSDCLSSIFYFPISSKIAFRN